jgi:hypothetical protein
MHPNFHGLYKIHPFSGRRIPPALRCIPCGGVVSIIAMDRMKDTGFDIMGWN